MKKTIDELNFNSKKVLVRVDFNVPLNNGVVESAKRITAAIPTIKKIVSEGGKVILLSHLGRVKTEEDKAKLSLEPVAKELSKLIDMPVKFVDETKGSKVEEAINNMNDGEIIMLQNTRFEDLNDRSESNNNPELGKYWASLGDVFVNDAYGAAHRSHASNVGIAQNINESAIGYLMAKELDMLSNGLNNPAHPFVAILGGAKVSDKIAVITNLLDKADKILIGGGMSYTFMKALGHKIGDSLLEESFVELAKEMLEKANGKIILPLDYAVSQKFEDSPRQETESVDIEDGYMGMDIGEKTIELFENALEGAKTVVWNGPMGVAEFSNYSKGTEAVATAIAKQENVYSIIGGGDSAAAAIKLGFEEKFTHISTGGGASLQFMEGKKLPGVEAIQDK